MLPRKGNGCKYFRECCIVDSLDLQTTFSVLLSVLRIVVPRASSIAVVIAYRKTKKPPPTWLICDAVITVHAQKHRITKEAAHSVCSGCYARNDSISINRPNHVYQIELDIRDWRLSMLNKWLHKWLVASYNENCLKVLYLSTIFCETQHFVKKTIYNSNTDLHARDIVTCNLQNSFDSLACTRQIRRKLYT